MKNTSKKQQKNDKSITLDRPKETNIDVDLGLKLFENMSMSRQIEDKLHIMKRQGRLPGRLVTGRGQEAIPVGATLALESHDMVCPLHRDLGASLTMGMTAEDYFMSYLYKEGGPARGRDGDNHFGNIKKGVFPMISHLPASWPVAVGFGIASDYLNLRRVCLAFCGEGATSLGGWHESLNMAAVFNTPTVFVIENNQFAYSTPTSRQYRCERLIDRAKGYGIPGHQIDGNDAFEVYNFAKEAVELARNGGGPTLIEAETMRMDGHAVHDDASYVPESLINQWKEKDPIEQLEKFLLGLNVKSSTFEAIRSANADEIEKAVENAEAAPEPDPTGLEDEVYARL